MRLPSFDAYRLWAPTYDCNPNPLLALETRHLSRLIGCVRSKTIVDVGCGTGRAMSCFLESGATTFGVDRCPEMLDEARRKLGVAGTLVLADAAGLPFSTGIADLTISSFAVSYFRNFRQSIFEIARVTKPSARVIISDLHPAAAARGWTRSFRAGTSTVEIEHFIHPDEEYRAAICDAGLEETLRVDASFEEDERPLFLAAGKEQFFTEVTDIPAIQIRICHKR